MVTLRVDQVRLGNGALASREVVQHPGAVAIVALDGEDRIALVRQYRHPVATELEEIPAGKLEPGEDPLAAAQRELEEETGYRAGVWLAIGDFYTTPGFSDERMRLYLAQDLKLGQVHLDEDEELASSFLPLAEALDATLAGRFHDAKTIAGILLAARHLAGPEGRRGGLAGRRTVAPDPTGGDR